ncbi:MAG: MFS transporter, partial [Akkermansiaceae bacterium]
ILWEHFGQLRELWQERALRLSAVGAAFFWGYAGYLNLAAIGIAEKLTDLGDEFAEVSAVLMLAASLGIVLGGGIASAVCRKRIELGLVPLGGLVMVIGTLALAATPLESAWLKLWLLVAGAGGALMLVPLNANLQDLCPPKKRGKILAGLNLLDCLAGLLAVVIQLVLVAVGVPFWIQFIGLAVVCVIATNYSAKLLPQHVVRLVGLSLFKLFYKVKTTGAENMPKEGGVLLTPNHVSYVDAFILSVASPREVRFLMFDGYFKHPIIGPMVKLFNTVPISKTRAKDAVRVAAEALEDGAVVCIFPEGQLTRTGVMNEFKRGFEMIARKANCPVLPATMDGLWGSIFSYERNQFIYKSPYTARYGVSVKFGEPIPAGEASVPTVRSVIEANRADVFAERICVLEPEKVLMSSPLILRGGSVAYRSALEAILLLELDEKRKIVANALQIGDTNTICRGQTVMMDWSGLGAVRNTIAVALAQYLDLKLVVVDSVNEAESIPMLAHKYGVDHFCGGETMSQVHREHRLAGVCYDFSESAVQRSDAYPCLVTDGVVVSMSMPHPEENTATNQHQAGWGEGTWGRLLPGFFPQETDGGILLKGASVASSGLVVSGVTLDANAMVIVD